MSSLSWVDVYLMWHDNVCVCVSVDVPILLSERTHCQSHFLHSSLQLASHGD